MDIAMADSERRGQHDDPPAARRPPGRRLRPPFADRVLAAMRQQFGGHAVSGSPSGRGRIGGETREPASSKR